MLSITLNIHVTIWVISTAKGSSNRTIMPLLIHKTRCKTVLTQQQFSLTFLLSGIKTPENWLPIYYNTSCTITSLCRLRLWKISALLYFSYAPTTTIISVMIKIMCLTVHRFHQKKYVCYTQYKELDCVNQPLGDTLANALLWSYRKLWYRV